MTPKQILAPTRYLPFVLCLLLLALAAFVADASPFAWIGVAILAGLSLLGVWDLFQRSHSILRNYPLIGHIRWVAELVRPEIRQYLVEADEEAVPFSRSQRSLVYERAKGEPGEHPFGTLLDVYRNGYEFFTH